MSVKRYVVGIAGNDKKLGENLVGKFDTEGLEFKWNTGFHTANYWVYIINFTENIEQVSQELIKIYADCQKEKKKLGVVLYFEGQPNSEKIYTIRKQLDGLGGVTPIHRLIVTKDLYGVDKNSSELSINRQVLSQIKEKKVVVSKKGKKCLNPLFVGDFMTGLTKILLLHSTTSKTHFLFGEPITDLELSYLIKQKVSDKIPDLEIVTNTIDSFETPEYQNAALSTQAEIGWRPESDLYQDINKIIEWNMSANTGTDWKNGTDSPKPVTNGIIKIFNLKKIFRQKVKEEKYRFGVNFKRMFFRVSFIVAVYFVASAIIFSITGTAAVKYLEESIADIRKGDIASSAKSIGKSEQYSKIAGYIYTQHSGIVGLVNPDISIKTSNLFLLIHYLETAINNLQQTYTLTEKIYQSIGDQEQKGNLSDGSLAVKSSLALVYENLTQIGLLVEDRNLPDFVLKTIKTGNELSQISTTTSQISEAMKLIDLLPVLLTDGSFKRLSIIVQDPSEVRGSGGIVRQIGIMNFKSGKLVSNKIYSAAEMDQIGDGKVQAPLLVVNHTGDQVWKVRDMGYYADFAKTSQYLSWYIERYTGNTIDILISLNTSFFQHLFEETKTENSENYLQTLLSLYSNKNLPLASLGKVFLNESGVGNIHLFVKDEEKQKTINNLVYSGSVSKYNCSPSLTAYAKCVPLTSYLNESNFSDLPISQTIKRSSIHQINIGTEGFNHEYQIKYHFNSPIQENNREYQGVYQVYLSPNSELSGVEVDGQVMSLEKVVKERITDFDYFQIPFSFSYNQDHTVTLKFTQPLSLQNLSAQAYSFTELRQSGVNDEGTILSVKFPEKYSPSVVTSEITAKTGQLTYQYPRKTSSFGIGLGAAGY